MKSLQLLAKVDIEHMAALAAAEYGDCDIASRDFLQWQCFENPSGKAKAVLAVDDSGRAVGESVQLPARFRAFGEDVLAYNYVNTLISKENRALQLFYRLHKASFEAAPDAAFFYSLPNPNSYPLFCKLFSAATVGDVPLLLLPIRPRALARRSVGKWAAAVPNFRYLGLPVSGRGACVDEVALSNFSADEFDALWDAVRDRQQVKGVRDAAFVRWRFLQAPGRGYTLFRARKDGRLCGYLACCMREVDGVQNAMLVDIVSLEKNSAAALIKQFFAYAKANDAQLAGALMTKASLEYRALRRAGFMRCPEKLLPQPFKLTLVNADIRYHNMENWFFTMADSDAV